MSKKLLYIDIDGVLLGKIDPGSPEIVLANHAKEFLEYCLANYKCYWISTHCKNGSAAAAINIFKQYADEFVINLVRSILPTSWGTLKTEAIDFSSDFYLVDDQLLYTEIDGLYKNNSFEKWININTRVNPDDLMVALSILQEKDIYGSVA